MISIYVYVYYGSCAMRLDYVWILSLDLAGISLLQMRCNPLTLMFAPSFVECLLRTLNCHVYEQCFAEPLQCRNGVSQYALCQLLCTNLLVL